MNRDFRTILAAASTELVTVILLAATAIEASQLGAT